MCPVDVFEALRGEFRALWEYGGATAADRHRSGFVARSLLSPASEMTLLTEKTLIFPPFFENVVSFLMLDSVSWGY